MRDIFNVFFPNVQSAPAESARLPTQPRNQACKLPGRKPRREFEAECCFFFVRIAPMSWLHCNCVRAWRGSEDASVSIKSYSAWGHPCLLQARALGYSAVFCFCSWRCPVSSGSAAPSSSMGCISAHSLCDAVTKWPSGGDSYVTDMGFCQLPT